MTSSTRYLVEAGRIRPETRLTAIRSKPAARIPRRGLMSAQTWGRFFHAFLVFLSFEEAFASFSVGISGGRSEPLVFRCPRMWTCYMAQRLSCASQHRRGFLRGNKGASQSAPVSARAVGAAMGLSRFNTVEINSLTEIPRWPHRRRLRLV